SFFFRAFMAWSTLLSRTSTCTGKSCFRFNKLVAGTGFPDPRASRFLAKLRGIVHLGRRLWPNFPSSRPPAFRGIVLRRRLMIRSGTMAKYSRAGRRTLVGTLSLLASVHVPQYVLADDAGTKPAVSGLNAKVEGAFGDIDGEGFGYGGGSVAAPLGHQFGVQLDVLGGSYDGEFVGSGGGHAFWRDPDVGLLGLYASYTKFDGNGGVHQSKYGVEGELYLDRLTLSGVGGYAGGDVSTHGFSIA